MVPIILEPLSRQIERVGVLHRADLATGFGAVWLPDALARKKPGAARELAWQYVFPARQRSLDLLRWAAPRAAAINTREPLGDADSDCPESDA